MRTCASAFIAVCIDMSMHKCLNVCINICIDMRIDRENLSGLSSSINIINIHINYPVGRVLLI